MNNQGKSSNTQREIENEVDLAERERMRERERETGSCTCECGQQRIAQGAGGLLEVGEEAMDGVEEM